MSTITDDGKMVEEEVKLCVNCKHSKHVFNWQCHHPLSDAWVKSPVDGDIVMNKNSKWMAWCENARSKHGQCKQQGVLFERKDAELTTEGLTCTMSILKSPIYWAIIFSVFLIGGFGIYWLHS